MGAVALVIALSCQEIHDGQVLSPQVYLSHARIFVFLCDARGRYFVLRVCAEIETNPSRSLKYESGMAPPQNIWFPAG